MKKTSILFAVLALMFVFTTNLNANGLEKESVNSVALSGKVIDLNTGEPLAGVKVGLENSNNSSYSDLDGNFTINGLIPGKYKVTSSLISYESNKVEVDLTTNYARKVEIKLDQLK
jgi:5-hydroxyisourate hydrolase-like protein (transthyretin family)